MLIQNIKNYKCVYAFLHLFRNLISIIISESVQSASLLKKTKHNEDVQCHISVEFNFSSPVLTFFLKYVSMCLLLFLTSQQKNLSVKHVLRFVSAKVTEKKCCYTRLSDISFPSVKFFVLNCSKNLHLVMLVRERDSATMFPN